MEPDFVLMLIVTMFAYSMLFGAIMTPSPVQGVWIVFCFIMVIASVYGCIKIWKEKKN